MEFPVVLCRRLKYLIGDIIELGVGDGSTFFRLAEENQSKMCHAVDSFVGYRLETDEKDDQRVFGPGVGSQNGSWEFRDEREKRSLSNVYLFEGYVPEILTEVGESIHVRGGSFSFAHVDLSLYTPTLAALRWLWPRMREGGIIAVHEYESVPAPKNAGAAIGEFVEDLQSADVEFATMAIHHDPTDVIQYANHQSRGLWAWWTK